MIFAITITLAPPPICFTLVALLTGLNWLINTIFLPVTPSGAAKPGSGPHLASPFRPYPRLCMPPKSCGALWDRTDWLVPGRGRVGRCGMPNRSATRASIRLIDGLEDRLGLVLAWVAYWSDCRNRCMWARERPHVCRYVWPTAWVCRICLLPPGLELAGTWARRWHHGPFYILSHNLLLPFVYPNYAPTIGHTIISLFTV